MTQHRRGCGEPLGGGGGAGGDSKLRRVPGAAVRGGDSTFPRLLVDDAIGSNWRDL
jgi:hypothetical protein